jgi:hypothetical protein
LERPSLDATEKVWERCKLSLQFNTQERDKVVQRIRELETQIKELEARKRELEKPAAPTFAHVETALSMVGDPLEVLPELGQLDAYLKAPFTGRYPVQSSTVLAARLRYRIEEGKEYPGTDDRFYFLEASSTEVVDPAFLQLDFVFVDFAAGVVGRSEDSLHSRITPFVEDFFANLVKMVNEVVSTQLSFDRNTTESKRTRTTIEKLRPDWLAFLGTLLVFRGEEKGHSSGKRMQDAAAELNEKMDSWNSLFFGELKYVFGYALVGTSFQLYALHPDPSSNRGFGGASGVRSVEIGNLLNLSHIKDRFVLLQYMARFVRIFELIYDLMPRDAPPLGRISPAWKRPDSGEYSNIVFAPSFVKKTLVNFADKKMFNFDDLRKLYGLIKQNKLVNTIQCQTDYPKSLEDGLKLEGILNKNGNPRSDALLHETGFFSESGFLQEGLVLHLYPIGRMVQPKDVEEFKKCLLEISEAVDSLHKNRFCHRDIRWPNILQKVDASWMLIDLDFALEVKSRSKGVEWPNWKRGVPAKSEKYWTFKQDLWQFAMLVKDCHLIYGKKEDLVKALLKCSSAKGVRACIEKWAW